MKKAGRIFSEAVRDFPKKEGGPGFKCKSAKKWALASTEKPCDFLALESQKT